MEAVLGLIILAVPYFIPTIIAAVRGHQVGMVIVINLLLGWTIIGWIVALAIACGDRRPPVVAVPYMRRMPPPR